MKQMLLFWSLCLLFACSPPQEEIARELPQSTVVRPSQADLSYPVQPAVRATDPYPVPTPLPTKHPLAYPIDAPQPSQSIQTEFCDFTTVVASGDTSPKLQALQLSEPQLVYEERGEIALWEWLPDNERILLTGFDLVNGAATSVAKSFNITSQTVTTHAIDEITIWPYWSEQDQTVIYRKRTTDTDDEVVFEARLGMGSQPSQLIVGDLVSPPNFTAVNNLTYFVSTSDAQMRQMNMSSRSETTLSNIDPSSWMSQNFPNPRRENSDFSTRSYRWAWSNEGEKIVIYQYPVTFLYDSVTKEACELQLPSTYQGKTVMPLKAAWSQDSRYLAMMTANYYAARDWDSRVELTILDMQAKTMMTVQPSPFQYVNDFVWSPNSDMLAVLATAEKVPYEGEANTNGGRGFSVMGLYLVESTTGAFQRYLPNQLLGRGALQRSHAWSRDGSKLAIVCPNNVGLNESTRICTVDIRMGE